MIAHFYRARIVKGLELWRRTVDVLLLVIVQFFRLKISVKTVVTVTRYDIAHQMQFGINIYLWNPKKNKKQ